MEKVLTVGLFFDETICLTKQFFVAFKETSFIRLVNFSKLDFRNLLQSKKLEQPKITEMIIWRVA